MLITNAALYSETEITGWIHVVQNGSLLKTDDGHNVSVRKEGNIEFNDNEGANEQFTKSGSFLTASIGEGYRVLGCAE